MIELINGDALEVMRTLDAGSVQCCVTSPPYWGLRDYGTAMEIQFATDRDIPVFYLGNHDFCFAMDRDIPLFRLDEKAAKMILERIEY